MADFKEASENYCRFLTQEEEKEAMARIIEDENLRYQRFTTLHSSGLQNMPSLIFNDNYRTETLMQNSQNLGVNEPELQTKETDGALSKGSLISNKRTEQGRANK